MKLQKIIQVGVSIIVAITFTISPVLACETDRSYNRTSRNHSTNDSSEVTVSGTVSAIDSRNIYLTEKNNTTRLIDTSNAKFGNIDNNIYSIRNIYIGERISVTGKIINGSNVKARIITDNSWVMQADKPAPRYTNNTNVSKQQFIGNIIEKKGAQFTFKSQKNGLLNVVTTIDTTYSLDGKPISQLYFTNNRLVRITGILDGNTDTVWATKVEAGDFTTIKKPSRKTSRTKATHKTRKNR